MSDSSVPSDSLSENNCGTELDLEKLFNDLTINSSNLNEPNSKVIEINKSVSVIDLSNSNRIKMSLPPLDIKNLSVIPHFDGNSNKLHRFITASESILNHYYDRVNVNNFQNVLLMNGILNKLEGRAEEVVAINGANSWDDIKNALVQNFGDQRDENCLNQDLVNSRQKPNETPYQFHERVLHLLNTICNYVDLKCVEAEKKSKRDFFTKQALKTFVAGLRDPLGPIIRAMRPSTLAQAIQYITEEENIKYYQRSNTQPNNPQYKKPILPNRPTSQPQFRQNTLPQTNHTYPYTSNQFPRGPINIPRHPNPPVQRYPTNQQTFGKPQNQNVWKQNPKLPQPKPEPMSVSTRNTTPQFKNQYSQRIPNYFQNHNQKPTFISEELFNTEFENQDQPEYSNYNQEEQPECSYDYQDEHDYENQPHENFQQPSQTDNQT